MFRHPFWKEQPALLYALAALIGTSAPLFFGHYLWASLFFIYLVFEKAFPQILLLIASIFFGISSALPELKKPKETRGIFSPSHLSVHESPFTKQMKIKGTYRVDGKKLPCTIFLPINKTRPKVNGSYLVDGRLSKRGNAFFLMANNWSRVPYTFSLAELRYKTKEKLKKHFNQRLGKRSARFLNALCTGDPPDRLLRYQFGRVGLQHILAVSGFHFGILIAFLSYIFRFFLREHWKIGALFITTSLFFIFIGSSASVERSYITALFYLISKWTSRPVSGLNLLGVAGIVEILFNPFISENIGFQLSFLSSLGILLFYPLMEELLQKIIRKRKKGEIEALSLLDQHGYIVATFFRKVISLNLAVSFSLFPLLLYHFHQFPLLSLLYNLFAPALVGVIGFLFLLGIAFDLLFEPIGSCFFYLTDQVTKFLLDLISNPPLAMDVSLWAKQIPAWCVILYLIPFVFFGIYWKEKKKQLYFQF